MDRSSGQVKYLAATQFETAEARWAFPCLDEPGLKATFDIRIGRKTDLMSLSNSPMSASGLPVEGYDGYVWDEYATTPIQSTYLVAFAIGEFASVVSDPLGNEVTFKLWTRPDYISDGITEYTRQIQAQISEYYEGIFGVDFPLPKQDQITLPSKGGAMENWGLITYGDTGLLMDPNQVLCAIAW